MRIAPTIASLALAALLLSPLSSSAQSFGGITSSGSPFDISVSPQFPSPHESATLSFTSATINLADATLKINVDGKDFYAGNVRPVAIPLGGAGNVASVIVTVTSNGTSESRTVQVQPEDVTLVAEPVASAPPLYPGKPEVPIQGDVRVVAMADLRNAAGGRISPSSCSYTWTVDEERVDEASGIGKDSILVASPLQYRARNVSVTVESQDGSLVGGATISIIPEESTMRIYRDDPLLGILFDHALSGSYAIQGSEDTLYAAPFSLPTTGGLPTIQWSLNGAAAQTGPTITLRPSGEGQGGAALAVTASVSSLLQATANLSLSFNTSQGGFNLFGL